MVIREKCCGCGACYSICPQKCITMIPDTLGFLYPVIDENKCIHCNACERVCPAIHSGCKEIESPYTWGGHVRDENIRRASSSGGLFSLLAEDVLKEGGVVFGAALSTDCSSLKHIRIESIEKLGQLRGSKYLQSSIDDVYLDVESDLKKGKKVLFSGTPCQISGLKLFLGKEFDNLLTIEIICHGTPSPKLYRKYIKYMTDKLGSTIKGVFFRDEVGRLSENL